MGALGGVFILKNGLRILIWALELPFSVPPKTPKMGVLLAILGVPKMDVMDCNGVRGQKILIFSFVGIQPNILL